MSAPAIGATVDLEAHLEKLALDWLRCLDQRQRGSVERLVRVQRHFATDWPGTPKMLDELLAGLREEWPTADAKRRRWILFEVEQLELCWRVFG